MLKGKKRFKACVCMMLGLWMAAAPAAAQSADVPAEKEVIMRIGSPLMLVNMNEVQLDAVPVVHNARTYLPLRALAENLGAKVNYYDGTPKVDVVLDGKTVSLRTDSTVFQVNGEAHVMNMAPYINGASRTMVPVRIVSEGLGFDVKPLYETDGTTRSVVVKNQG